MVAEKKAPGGENGIVIPALDSKMLQRAQEQRVKSGLFQVAVQQRLARPADLG